MDIARKIISVGIAIMCTANEYAEGTIDVCSKTPGHWQGIYTLKDQEACKLYNGCTHLIMADVSYVSNNEYHINLNPAVGVGGEFNIQCENGIATSPIPNSKVSITCNAMNHCFVIYDDPRLTSEMMNS